MNRKGEKDAVETEKRNGKNHKRNLLLIQRKGSRGRSITRRQVRIGNIGRGTPNPRVGE